MNGIIISSDIGKGGGHPATCLIKRRRHRATREHGGRKSKQASKIDVEGWQEDIYRDSIFARAARRRLIVRGRALLRQKEGQRL